MYNEIIKLHNLLVEEKIWHSFEPRNDGYHITVNYKNVFCSAIEFEYSYGYKEDKIEIMGCLTEEEQKCDDVIGHLTAEEVLQRIKYCIENETNTYVENKDED